VELCIRAELRRTGAAARMREWRRGVLSAMRKNRKLHGFSREIRFGV
jgi:hypothetical protein